MIDIATQSTLENHCVDCVTQHSPPLHQVMQLEIVLSKEKAIY